MRIPEGRHFRLYAIQAVLSPLVEGNFAGEETVDSGERVQVANLGRGLRGLAFLPTHDR